MLMSVYDVAPDGAATRIDEADPEAAPADGAAWRWLHGDVNAPAFRDWAARRLPPLAAATLLQAETRPRCDHLGDGAAINLRGVNLNPENRVEDMVSLRIWATDRLVVTARMRRVMTIKALVEAFEAGRAPAGPCAFLAAAADGLTDRLDAVVVELEAAGDEVEDRQVEGEAVAAAEIARIHRAAIMLRRFAGPQREALHRLAALPGAPMTDALRPAMRETANRAARNAEALEALRDRMAVAQAHDEARAAVRMGRHGHLLSIVAAIFLPLGFLTGVFGVNVAGMPGVESPAAFWLLCAGMTAMGIGLALAFRWMRWF